MLKQESNESLVLTQQVHTVEQTVYLNSDVENSNRVKYNFYDLTIQLYADDSELHVSFLTNDSSYILFHLQKCVDSVQNWILWNKLKLNQRKTKFLRIGHVQQCKKYLPPFLLPLEKIHPSKSVRNLGVISDLNLIFRSQVLLICRTHFYHIRDPRRIQNMLSWIVQSP